MLVIMTIILKIYFIIVDSLFKNLMFKGILIDIDYIFVWIKRYDVLLFDQKNRSQKVVSFFSIRCM